ncbi:MAG: glycerol-3-phosphate dehydrogenase [Nitrospinae bacterium CG11_big_fil_rev_8_21_14_0_20_56_8]|nr:MAG: glycerol-3-phosphate dehydrogenase [Nitrospinae bacterium CG11_big_fil_rev_8_21_14_0_20_56_8]
MEADKIGIVGAGSWGTALSLMLSSLGHSIDLWVFEEDLCQIMQEHRENRFFLPGYPLPGNVRPTHSFEEAVRGKNVLILVVPTHVVRETVSKLQPFIQPGCLVINASKGIENDTLCTIHQILEQTIEVPIRLASVSGPTFAVEVARGVPSALVAAAETLEIAEEVQGIFSHPRMKVFTSTDLQGVEIGGALKNVIAIATGISDGLGLGYNTRAALITRGLVEITRIGTARGARPETFAGLSGLGDLVLTCTGDLSRNRSVGMRLGKGENLNDIIHSMKMVAEGIRTVKSAFALKNQLNIQASLIEETYRVLHDDKSPQQALDDLMKVNITTEFSGIRGLQ